MTIGEAGPTARMGHQPGLDGLRALSVVAVVLYHAGFGWQYGGFLGVEVFFVVSGFLITTLLLEERAATGRVSLRDFWVRRARRLLPALGVLLLAVALWALVVGSPEQVTQVRRDLPWALGYLANWGQVVGDVPYFATTDPPLLRHLWSLGVEEQWYLLWPLVFLGLSRPASSPRRVATGLVAAVGVVAVLMLVVQAGGPGPLSLGPWEQVDRTNFLYLSTVTRSGGLLLGAAAAFVWQPWRTASVATRAERRITRRGLDVAGWLGLAVLAVTFVVGDLTSSWTYPWVLTLVGVASTVVIAVTVHPSADGIRRVLGWKPLVEVGRRSYGLYLWHWPVFVVLGATEGAVRPFLLATAVSVVLSEACFRLVEEPVRRGALGRWWHERQRVGAAPWWPVAASSAAVIALGGWYVQVEPYDVAVGGDDAVFVLPVPSSEPDATTQAVAIDDPIPAQEQEPPPPDADPAEPGPAGPDATADGAAGDAGTSSPGAADDPSPPAGDGSLPPDPSSTDSPAPTPAPSTGPPSAAPDPPPPGDLPITVAVVGDSQAHSLAINLPSGIESTFTIRNGSLNGCSVHDTGIASSTRGVSTNFGRCAGWTGTWGRAAQGADVALVVLGAWDVLDVAVDGSDLVFATPAHDALLTANLGRGLDVLTGAGAHVALLEVACMRPKDVEGAGVPALPERAEDGRVAHLNALFRQVAAGRADTDFVEGPDAWCGDEAISNDLGYRWDGVHVYRPGANLIYQTIAADLLALAG